jgi:hypothetical protein
VSNPKTAPSARKPVANNGWIRKSDLNALLDRYFPVPTQIVSNEKFHPMLQTAEQRLEYEIESGVSFGFGLNLQVRSMPAPCWPRLLTSLCPAASG